MATICILAIYIYILFTQHCALWIFRMCWFSQIHVFNIYTHTTKQYKHSENIDTSRLQVNQCQDLVPIVSRDEELLPTPILNSHTICKHRYQPRSADVSMSCSTYLFASRFCTVEIQTVGKYYEPEDTVVLWYTNLLF